MDQARIVRLAAARYGAVGSPRRSGRAEPTVVTRRRRYADRVQAGLHEGPRPGTSFPLPQALRDRAVELALTEPPAAQARSHWHSWLLATALAADSGPGGHLICHLPGPVPQGVPGRGRPHRWRRVTHRRLERLLAASPRLKTPTRSSPRPPANGTLVALPWLSRAEMPNNCKRRSPKRPTSLARDYRRPRGDHLGASGHAVQRGGMVFTFTGPLVRPAVHRPT